jgi:hypothetical protein
MMSKPLYKEVQEIINKVKDTMPMEEYKLLQNIINGLKLTGVEIKDGIN